jgi:hypothetical protein
VYTPRRDQFLKHETPANIDEKRGRPPSCQVCILDKRPRTPQIFTLFRGRIKGPVRAKTPGQPAGRQNSRFLTGPCLTRSTRPTCPTRPARLTSGQRDFHLVELMRRDPIGVRQRHVRPIWSQAGAALVSGAQAPFRPLDMPRQEPHPAAKVVGARLPPSRQIWWGGIILPGERGRLTRRVRRPAEHIFRIGGYRTT